MDPKTVIEARKAVVALGILRADTASARASLPVGALARAVGKITREAVSKADLVRLLGPWMQAGVVRWEGPGRLVAAGAPLPNAS